ncbi:MAG: hypothetical protein HC783_06630 [Rhodobacteraceae bacterium]|nr:hypothetical protein [Paracoccaceae bacterium]
MTAKDRADQTVALSMLIFEFLAKRGQPMDAGTLVREFCEQERVARADAEVALSMLLNQRAVVVGGDMRLVHNVRVAA